jgi:hypothetical protein
MLSFANEVIFPYLGVLQHALRGRLSKSVNVPVSILRFISLMWYVKLQAKVGEYVQVNEYSALWH